MDERFQAILDSLPPKSPRSRLEPYWELIRELRRRGRTYREIAQILAEKCQVTVAPSTVHDFVRLRTRHRQRPQPTELRPPESASGVDSIPVAGDIAPGAESDVQGRIEALKQRRPPEKPEKARFEYNENQPLQLVPGTKHQE